MSFSYGTSLLYYRFDEESSVQLAETIRQAVNQTTRRLIVVLVSPEFDHNQHEHLASKWDWIQNTLVLAYVPAAHTAQLRDDPLFNTDVILVPGPDQAAQHLSQEKWDVVFTLEGGMTLFLRPTRVASFVRMFKPSIECDAVPIQDVYGPTAWDSNIQALVVSRETVSGASSVAQLRSEKSLPPLDLFVIDVISSSSVVLPERDTAVLRDSKLSSTYIREWLARKEGPQEK
ncbi:hypothetical protein RSAG8_02362, partial [Rhizoctonia solani AG-8 WAC10335]